MPIKWLGKHPNGYSEIVQTYLIEEAPSMEPGAPRHAKQTWVILNWPQPDGTCMNCRQRPGLLDPIGGSYTCGQCLDVVACEIGRTRTLAKAA